MGAFTLDQIEEQLLAQVAAGVEKFHPAWVKARFDGVSTDSGEVKVVLDATLLRDTIANCSACALSASRLGVCVSALLEPADVFVLAEAPTPLAESSIFESKSNLFEGSGFPDALLGRLLARLPANLKVHRSYALKCVPRKNVSLSERNVCAEKTLVNELLCVQPKWIFVFGAMAESALRSTLDVSACEHLKSRISTHVFPSAEQLDAHVGWRAAVWAEIQNAIN
jgi:uracil-DNA glycosylase